MKRRIPPLTLACLLLLTLAFLLRPLPVSGEELTLEEQVTQLQEQVASLQAELENAQKKSQTWKSMYYSLKKEYDALTGQDQSGVDQPKDDTKAAAVKTALSLLSQTPYSKEGLTTQLKLAGFSEEDAIFGVGHCGADWTEQATLRARSYLSSTSFSLDGLVSQLILAGFTTEEANEGARRAYTTSGEDSELTYSTQNALNEAIGYLTSPDSYSRAGMIKKLLASGYTEEEAVYAVDNCGADWMDQARRQAAFYLRYQNLSHDELVALLLEQGFTEEEAEYGFDQNGL